MTTEVIERNDGITVIEIGIPGPQGPPGTLIEVEEDGVVKTTPLRNLDFRTGFDVSEPTSRTAQIDLDLSEVAAGGELAGTLDAPTVDALHSGSTHQSIADDLNAHEIDVVGAHNASAVAFTPTDTIVSADTQSAVVEALTDARAYTDDGHVILSSRRGAVDGVAGLDSGGTVPDAQIPAAVARDSEVSAADAAHVAAADPHTGYQKESEKGATSGYASLDSAGKVPTAQIPAVAFGSVFVVASQAEMLALGANPGDIAVRSDVSQTFILTALPASTLGNWVELLSGAGGVTSVNGATGAVTGVELTANKGAASGYAALDGSGFVPDAQIASTIARDSEVSAADAAHVAAGDPHTGYQKESEKGSISGYAALDGSGYVPDAQINPAVARDTEVSDAVTAHTVDGDPHTGYQKESEKGAASGYASLDGSGTVPDAQIPGAVARDTEVTSAISTHAGLSDPHPGYLTPAEATAAYEALGAAVLKSMADAKGDLLVGTANDVVGRLAAGSDRQMLIADSTVVSGLRYKDQPEFWPEDYFQVGDPDDSASAQRAADAASGALTAGVMGTLRFKPGKTYAFSSPQIYRCHVNGVGATILYTDPGTNDTAITLIGQSSESYRYQWRTAHLPILKRSAVNGAGPAGTDVGVKIVNIRGSQVKQSRVQNFSTGWFATSYPGVVTGAEYAELFVPWFESCAVSIRIEPADASGWVNDLTWIGGWPQGNTTFDGSGTRMLKAIGGANRINNHRFIGTAWENGGITSDYWIELQDADNFLFDWCRWEGTPKMQVHGFSSANVVRGGYGVDTLVGNITVQDSSKGVVVYGYDTTGTLPSLSVRTPNGKTTNALTVYDASANIRAVVNYLGRFSLRQATGGVVTDSALGALVGGDAQFRLLVDYAGKLLWGSGAVAGDTNLYRNAANTLKTDGDFVVGGTLTAAGLSGTVSSFAKSGDTALTGAVTISGGSGIALTESGQNVSIAATGSAAAGFLSIEKWGIS